MCRRKRILGRLNEKSKGEIYRRASTVELVPRILKFASRKSLGDDWSKGSAGVKDIRREPGGNEREIICEVYTQDQRKRLPQKRR